MAKPAHNVVEASPNQKRERFEARISPDQKKLLKKAAALSGRSMTDFVVSSAQEAAIRTIRESAIISLGVRDQEAFADALIHPPKPGPRLRAAAKRYKKTKGA